MARHPIEDVRWGAPVGRSVREERRFHELVASGHFLLLTDRNGRSLDDPSLGSRRLLNWIQQHAWTTMVVPSLRRGHESGHLPDYVSISSVRVAWRGSRRAITPEPALPGTFWTREKKEDSEFTMEDIVEVTEIHAPLIDDQPASFMLFLQHGHMRAILGDTRPDRHPEWKKWPSKEHAWLMEAFAQVFLTFNYGHVPRLLKGLNRHAIALALGVRPPHLVQAIDAVGGGRDIDAALEQAFHDYPWEHVLGEWQMSPDWKQRMPVFQDALKCLRAARQGAPLPSCWHRSRASSWSICEGTAPESTARAKHSAGTNALSFLRSTCERTHRWGPYEGRPLNQW
jgi:hypothetical protein